jgi:hypothetical protein
VIGAFREVSLYSLIGAISIPDQDAQLLAHDIVEPLSDLFVQF